MQIGWVREVDPVSPALQVFQVRKVQGTNLGKIYAMKVLRKVSHLLSQQILSSYHPQLPVPGKTAVNMMERVPILALASSVSLVTYTVS